MRKEEIVEALRQLSPAVRREVLAEFSSEQPGAAAPRVFLSYSRDDTPFVRDLAGELERGGVRVWFDVRELAIGEDYRAATANALRDCDFCVVVVSPYSMSSGEVGRELAIAGEVGTTIVPVILQDAALVEPIRPLQWVDFRCSFEAPLAALLGRLHGTAKDELSAHRLEAATKPLQSARVFVPLFQKNGPPSVRWFNALLLAAAGALFLQASFVSPKTKVDWRGLLFLLGLLGTFAGLLFHYAFRVANRRETLASVRASLWSLALTAPLATLAVVGVFEPRSRWPVWGCAVVSELSLLAAIAVAELSPSFRRQLRARPEMIEFYPRWWPFRRRTAAPDRAL